MTAFEVVTLVALGIITGLLAKITFIVMESYDEINHKWRK